MTHGTESAYTRGCRCDECREAARKARARRRAGDLRERTPAGLQSHGLNGYRRHRCRCEICTTANRLAMRRYVARLKGLS